MKSNIYIGFDFSINKPACTIFWNNEFYFFFWPLHQLKKDVELYEKYNVHIIDRNLKPITHGEYSSSELTERHIYRAKALADLIVKDIQEWILHHNLENYDIYIASEGLSYGSAGDATLNLATYKGVLLVKLIENFKIKKLFTFSPISVKGVAGCATKEKRKDKLCMIKAFREDSINHPFKYNLGEFIKKKNYAQGVDDIVDSYFVLKKMIIELEDE